MQFLDYLQGWSDGAVIIRLVIAAFFGSLIGLERIYGRHNAGVRTFSLVCLGAAAAAALNVKLAMIPSLGVDGSRILASVVSGIGFLGAGTILITGRSQIRGLTTAATLWVSATMGLMIGAGYLVIGTACFVLVMIANRLLQRVSQQVEEHSRYISLYIEVEKEKGIMQLRKYIKESGYKIGSMNKAKEKTLLPSDAAIVVSFDLGKTKNHHDIIDQFSALEYVNYVEEI